MGVVEFGKQLFATGDLDPVYVMLHHSGFSLQHKERWSVAYWMFYSSGIVSQLSEQTGVRFWESCIDVLLTAPRGTERRHFRGSAAFNAIRWLQDRYLSPEKFVQHLCLRQADGETFQSVSKRTMEAPLFGPWIAFKVCDMMERVLGRQLDSIGCDLLFFKDPADGAERAAKVLGLKSSADAIQYLAEAFKNQKAPPSFNRYVNLQEVETVLCKWKSGGNGHYDIGKDTREVAHALRAFPCKTSDRLLTCLQENTTLCPKNHATLLSM